MRIDIDPSIYGVITNGMVIKALFPKALFSADDRKLIVSGDAASMAKRNTFLLVPESLFRIILGIGGMHHTKKRRKKRQRQHGKESGVIFLD